jgi:hypothetical protein
VNAPSKVKMKKCRVCKEPFMPRTTIQPCCYKYECQVTYATAHALKQAKKREKAERQDIRARKEKIKTWQEWFDECKAIAQKLARLRDRFDGCVSCHKPPNWHGQWHGSHFRPAGNCKAVALNLWNIHKACSECNKFKSGNLTSYEQRLIEKIGIEKVAWLKAQNHAYRHSIDYLKRYKQVMGKRCRRLGKRIAVQDPM